jgi:ribonuclease P protein component
LDDASSATCHNQSVSQQLPIFLKKHADYQRVYRDGRKGRATLCAFVLASQPALQLPAPSPAGMRIGLTVPKVLGKAVDRNRIKRRMRAALRQQPPELLTPTLDLVLHPRRTVLTCEFPRLVSDLEKLLRNAVLPTAAATLPATAVTTPPKKRATKSSSATK